MTGFPGDVGPSGAKGERGRKGFAGFQGEPGDIVRYFVIIQKKLSLDFFTTKKIKGLSGRCRT